MADASFGPGLPKGMVIVTDFGRSVQTYIDGFDRLCFPRPTVCAHCQACNTFIRHGYYWRHPLDSQRVYRLRISRWLCTACRRTLSLLPSFLLRFRHYLLVVIQQVVVVRCEDAASWQEVLRRCAPQDAPSERTVKRWCRSFSQHAPTWLAAVQQMLSQHDAALPWLDALGEPTEPRDAAGALLRAATHLLAWAKTRWTHLLPYGLHDRLRFLWHWGHGRGLGRLV